MKKPFESFLATQIEEFIAYRQSLGYSLRPVRDFLLIFDRYLMESKTNRGLLRAGTLKCGKLTLNIQRPHKDQQVAIAIFEQNILFRDKSYSLL